MSYLYNSSELSLEYHEVRAPFVAKKLLNDFEVNNFKVVLRIKPSGNASPSPFTVDGNSLLATAPKGSVTHKLNSATTKKKFTFSQILGGETTQKETFEKCVVPCLKSFLQGEDALVMAYGTTSAGKTYTMQGNPNHPGLIPQSLAYLFSTLEDHLLQNDRLKPNCGNQLHSPSPQDIHEDRLFKKSVLNLDLIKYQKATDTTYMPFQNFCPDEDEFFTANYESAEFKEMESQIEKDVERMSVVETDQFTVWISMVEIYNENIYDLLQFPTKGKSRPCLSVGENEEGVFYAKNLRHVLVRNSHEAYQVCQFGRTNLIRASTGLNDKSSRSHCILTVSLVRDRDGGARLHRFSFVDLAGSERIKKTTGDPDRVAESKCINKSLAVLGQCLQALKESQTQQRDRAKRVIPVRDSKMTMLFKNALVGNEKLSFIINISSDGFLFDETLHVLKFSALAQEIVTDPTSFKRPPPRFSINFTQSLASSCSDVSQKSEELGLLKRQLEDKEDQVLELEALLDEANRKIISMNEQIEEFENRNCNMSSEMQGIMKRMRENHEQELARKKQEYLKLEKRERELSRTVWELESKNDGLREKIVAKNQKLKKVHEEAVEDYNKLVDEFDELRLKKEELERELFELKQDPGDVVELKLLLVAKEKELEEAKRSCEQELSGKEKELEEASCQLKNEIEELKLQLAEKEGELKKKHDEKIQLEDERKRSQKEFEDLKIQMKEELEEARCQLKNDTEKFKLLIAEKEEELKKEREEKIQLEDERKRSQQELDDLKLRMNKELEEARCQSKNEIEKLRVLLAEKEVELKKEHEEKIQLADARKRSQQELDNLKLQTNKELEEARCQSKNEIEKLKLLLAEKEVELKKEHEEKIQLADARKRSQQELDNLQLQTNKELEEARCQSKDEIEELKLLLAEKEEELGVECDENFKLEEEKKSNQQVIEDLRMHLCRKDEQMIEEYHHTEDEIKKLKLRLASKEEELKKEHNEKSQLEDARKRSQQELDDFKVMMGEESCRFKKEIEELKLQLTEKELALHKEHDEKLQLGDEKKSNQQELENLKLQMREKQRELDETCCRFKDEFEELKSLHAAKEGNLEKEHDGKRCSQQELENLKLLICVKDKELYETCCLFKGEIAEFKLQLEAKEKELEKKQDEKIQLEEEKRCKQQELETFKLRMGKELEETCCLFKGEIEQFKLQLDAKDKELEKAKEEKIALENLKSQLSEKEKELNDAKSCVKLERIETEKTETEKLKKLLVEREQELKRSLEQKDQLEDEKRKSNDEVEKLKLVLSKKEEEVERATNKFLDSNMNLELQRLRQKGKMLPLSNRTNVVSITPYRSANNWGQKSMSVDDLTYDFKENSFTPPKKLSGEDKNEEILLIKSSASKSRTPSVDVFLQEDLIRLDTTVADKKSEEDEEGENKENGNVAATASKSTRKARTAKKRDPREHPALKKSTQRGRRGAAATRSPSPSRPTPAPRSVKKKLFTAEDDFLDLSDSSNFAEPEKPQLPKRSARLQKSSCVDQ